MGESAAVDEVEGGRVCSDADNKSLSMSKLDVSSKRSSNSELEEAEAEEDDDAVDKEAAVVMLPKFLLIGIAFLFAATLPMLPPSKGRRALTPPMPLMLSLTLSPARAVTPLQPVA